MLALWEGLRQIIFLVTPASSLSPPRMRGPTNPLHNPFCIIRGFRPAAAGGTVVVSSVRLVTIAYPCAYEFT